MKINKKKRKYKEQSRPIKIDRPTRPISHYDTFGNSVTYVLFEHKSIVPLSENKQKTSKP